MSGDPSGPRPAWKGAAGGSPRRGTRYAWKPEETPAGPPPRRLWKLAIALGAAVCVVLIYVIIMLLQRPPRAGLVLVGADPAADVDRLDVPLDLYGWWGGRQLAQWAEEAAGQDKSRWGTNVPEVVGEDKFTPTSLRAKDFDAWAGHLADSRRDPLIVVFGLHGAAGADGPYLVTAGGGRLPLRTVVETFAGDRFRKRKVVLVLDPARRTADPERGVLHNDCVRGLLALEPTVAAAASELVVLCGSGPGQRSWDSEEWRAGAFTHAVLEGLRGGAAPAGETEISAWDLFQYAAKQTDDWTATNRPTRQTPVLLPKPDAGGRARAAAIKVTVRVGPFTPADPAAAPGATFQAPADLAAHWRTCRELEQARPGPEVYTPLEWRRYRELLLRYERLVRADERPAVGKLGPLLQKLERDLEDARGLRADGGSRAYALPLAAALGLTDVTSWSDAELQKFRELWAARRDEKKREQLWAEMRQAAGPAADVLRLRLASFLLQQAGSTEDPQVNTRAAADLLRAVYAADPGIPRPAEAHFLLMLFAYDWGGPKPPADLLQRAVAVRLLAERAALALRGTAGERPVYPYTEQVWPGVHAAIEAADRDRRQGEDLLFADAKFWPDARRHLDGADKQYKAILDTARLLQEALAARDRALADLPFLTRWQADQRLDELRLKGLEDLWARTHALDAKLADLSRQPNPAPDAAALTALTKEVHDPLDQLTQQFQERCRANFAVLQEDWQQIERLLTVPLIDADLRKTLVESSRAMTSRFNRERSAAKEGTSPVAEEPVRDRARRWGRLALAVLGMTIPDEQAGTTLLRAEALRSLLTDPGTAWEDVFDRAGDQIGKHWQALAAAAASAGDRAAAERCSRWAVAFAAPPDPEPATANRRLRWQRVLVGLAGRTFYDHWYAEGGEPYYRTAANAFLDDADKLVPAPADGPKPTVPGADEVKQLVSKTPSLKLNRLEKLHWTSEQSRTLEYSVAAPPALKDDGSVTLWAEVPAGPLRGRAEDQARVPAAVAAARRSLHLDAPLTARTADQAVGLRGYYRGQWLRGETLVQLDRAPVRTLVWTEPAADAGFAVRADDNLNLGAIAIVLDYSGSMAQKTDGNFDWTAPTSKFRQAQGVLEKVLRGLPQGTPISIRLFGHEAPPGSANPNPQAREVEETRATPSRQLYKGQVTWSQDNPAPLKELTKRLSGIQPKYGTPLIESMRQAKAQDFPPNFTGPRTLLVLTDGADTSHLPAVRVQEVRKEFEAAFGESDISVQLVLFRVDPQEVADARQQFERVGLFRTPGRLWETNDPNVLAENLEMALRPKMRLLHNGVPVEGVPRAGLAANRAGDPLHRLRPSGPVTPGLYEGLVFDSPQKVRLDRGDRLLVHLSSGADGVRFGRDLLAQEFPQARRKEEGDWVLGVPQNMNDETREDRLLRLMATLESKRGLWPGREGVLQQVRPRSVWWEVTPGGKEGAAVGPQRIANLFGFPAPAWEVVVEHWPADPEPRPVQLKVWCAEEPPPVGKRVPVTPGDSAVTLPPIDLDGERVEVSVSLEPQPLRRTADLTEPSPVPCLVVRVQHAPDRPVLVSLGDFPTARQEHRYYGKENYTAMFGPVTRDQLAGRAVQLELTSVTKLKAACTAIAIELPPPRRGEIRLQPLDLAPVGERR